MESDPMLTSSVSLRKERYTSINQKIVKTYLFIGGLCSFPFLGWYCWSNLKTGSRHCFLCQESRCRWKFCSGTLFSLSPFSSMIFFSLGVDRDAEEVKFVHGTLTGGGELAYIIWTPLVKIGSMDTGHKVVMQKYWNHGVGVKFILYNFRRWEQRSQLGVRGVSESSPSDVSSIYIISKTTAAKTRKWCPKIKEVSATGYCWQCL